jgi:hypothetical protein
MSMPASDTPVTRADIEEAVQRYSDKPREHVPARYRDPRNERDFSIGLAITLASMPGYGDAGPIYDEHDVLSGWRGIKLRDH